MKQSHWLLCVAKNCDWPGKITPLSNLSRASLSCGMKTYGETRIDLRNLQILKKMLEWSSQFFHQSSPVSRLCLEYCRRWKKWPRKIAVAVNIGGQSIQVLNEMSVIDGGNLCPLWLVILKSVLCSVAHYNCDTVVSWNGLEHSCRKARLSICVNTHFLTWIYGWSL